MTVELTVPIPLPSLANARLHWTAKAKHAAQQRQTVALFWRKQLGKLRTEPPYLITLVRLSPRPLDDDNLASAFKHVRDEVAAQLGLKDDRQGPELQWLYRQERSKQYGVRVRVQAGEALNAVGARKVPA